MPTSWLISPALSPDMQDRDLWENFEVSLKVLNSKMIICVTCINVIQKRETDLAVNVAEKF